MFDEDNMDDDAGGQSRYPTMPSLVALQQMKNRLHLAYLGKKLMKWTTLATAKELRKIAHEMNEYFVNYGDDYARAFMLLARSRYYYPSMNTVVLQNVGSAAACRVELDHRSVAGVKVLALNVVEEPFDPNEHLGIEKGGTTILDTKKAWRDLLKLSILMLQEREAFDLLHNAHKAANKKQNVLGKLVIPKIQNAIAYIKSELEEQEREETFRLKRFKQSKEKKTQLIKDLAKKEEKKEEFVCCKPVPVSESTPETESEHEPEPEPKIIAIPQEPNIIQKQATVCRCAQPAAELDQSTGKFVCPICKLADKNIDINVIACKLCLPEVKETKERADHLMAHINQVLALSRYYNKTLSGVDNEARDLNYANIKQQLENINSICACPHIAKEKKVEPCCKIQPQTQKDIKSSCCDQLPDKMPGTKDSCVYKTPGTQNRSEEKQRDCCIYSPVQNKSETIMEDCCGYTQHRARYMAEQPQLKPEACRCHDPSNSEPCSCEKDGVKKSDFQTYNLCSVSAIGGPYIQSTSNLYLPAPPFFYLYSGPYVHSQTGLHPICNSSIPPKITKKCFCSDAPYPGEFKQDNPICPCNSKENTCTCNDLLSQQPSKEVCTCESTETFVPIQLSFHNSQPDPTAKTYRKIFQSYLPPTSLPPTKSSELSKRLAKACEPYLKKTCLNTGGHTVREASEDGTIDMNNLNHIKSVSSKQNMACPCESVQQQTSFTCNSCSTLSSETSTTDASSKPPYFKKSTTYFIDVPQTFMPLLSCAKEGKKVSRNRAVARAITPVTSLSASISSGSAHPCPSFYLNTAKNLATHGISNTTLTAKAFNKFSPKQLTSFSPSREGQVPRPCAVSERESKHSRIIASYTKEETPECYAICKDNVALNQCALVSIGIQEDNPGFCSISSINLLNNSDPKSSFLVPYTRCVSVTHSMSENLVSNVSKQSSLYAIRKVNKTAGSCSNLKTPSRSSTPTTRDFSIYITITPDDISPYKTRQNRLGPCNIFQTSNTTKPDSSNFKDCSTYVNVVPKKEAPCVSEGRSFDVSKAFNKTKFFNEITSKDPEISNSMYTQNVQSCYSVISLKKNGNCATISNYIPFTPYTREGKPGPCGLPLICDRLTKHNTPITRKERSGISVVLWGTTREPIPLTPYTCKNRSETCEINHNSLLVTSTDPTRLTPFKRELSSAVCGVSETKITTSSLNYTASMHGTNARPVPYTREGIPGPCGLCRTKKPKSSVANNKEFTNLVPLTRKSRPGPSDLSENYAAKSLNNTIYNQPSYLAPVIQEGKPGPCHVSELNTSVNTKQFRNLISSKHKGKQGACDISDQIKFESLLCNIDSKKANTREGMPGPCSVGEIINFTNSLNKTAAQQPLYNAPYTREGMPGPCGLSMTKITGSSLRHMDARQFSNLLPYTREGRAGHCDISLPINTARSRINLDPCQFENRELYTREGRSGLCDTSMPINIARSRIYLYPKQFKDPAPYTREGKAGPCIIPIKNKAAQSRTDSNLVPYTRESKARPCDISMLSNTALSRTNLDLSKFMYPEPYTREGRAGPCDSSMPSNTTRSRTSPDPRLFKNLEPYTREGKAGPCDMSMTNNTAPSPTKSDPRQYKDLEPYTREGRAGLCNISQKNNTAKSRIKLDPRKFKDPAPYTREGKALPYDISIENNALGPGANVDSRKLTDPAPYTWEERPRLYDFSGMNTTNVQGKIMNKYSTNSASTRNEYREHCSVCIKNQITCSLCAVKSRESTNLVFFTRDGTPGPCGVTKTNPIAGSLYNKVVKQSTHNTLYRREGIPGPCGVLQTNIASSLNNTNPQEPIAPYTREGKPGPCGLYSHNVDRPVGNIPLRQLTTAVPFAYERTPCDISKANDTTSTLSKIYSKQSKNVERENNRWETTDLLINTREDIIPRLCNLFDSNQSTDVTVSAREGIPVCSPCIIDSRESKNIKHYTREGTCKPRGMTVSNSVHNKSSKQSMGLGLYTRESKPGPCGISGEIIADLEHNLNSEGSKKLRPYIIMGMPRSCSASEKNNILNFPSKPYTHVLSCSGEFKPRSCKACERKSITCLLCNLVPKNSTNLVPYEREGVPGPCGVSEQNNVTRSVGKMKYETIEPYTREGVPGPCGIYNKGLTFPRYETFASYTCHLKPGPRNTFQPPNTTDSGKFITSIPQPRNMEPHSLGQGNCDSKAFKFCDTQSCLMCQVFTPSAPYTLDGAQNSVNNRTKDATTYVTAIPCHAPHTRDEVLRVCGNCDRKSALSTSATESNRICKTRAPHIRINVTRSLNAVPCRACSYRPYATASAAPVMIIPSSMLLMTSSAAPSRSCCCKSHIPSALTLKSGPTCNESLHSAASNKFCSVCGRTASIKGNLQTTSAPVLKTRSNCDKFTRSRVSICEPCSGCGKTKLIMNCASNPSVKSIAIGTCLSRHRCATFKAAGQTTSKSITNTSQVPYCHKPSLSCTSCSKKRRESKESISSFMSNGSKTQIDESKFGFFEIGIKKVTKIYRHKNPDGTITNEKRVITIKTEKKCPEKLEATGLETGTIISSSLENETNSIRNKNKSCNTKCFRKSKSDVVQSTINPMAYPKVRYCISAQDFNTITELSNNDFSNIDTSKQGKFNTTASTVKPNAQSLCFNRLQNTDSGPKCDCTNKSSKPSSQAVAPTMPTDLVCANKLRDIDSGPKCDRLNKPIEPLCANRLQDTDGGSKCNYTNAVPAPTKTTHTTPVCANRLQDSDSGPKCDCANNTPYEATTPDKPTIPVCANRLQDSDSGPKCDCANKSPPEPTTRVCANRLQDSDSGPKCDCADKSPPVPSTRVCANRLQDSDSGPKCDCANKSFPEPTTRVCANRLQDSDSGPKCDCADKSPPVPSTRVCANRLQDSDSGPKCDCADKSPPVPSTRVCANRLQDSDSGPKCDCANKSSPEPSIVVNPNTPVCTNRIQNTNSGPKCDCANKSPPEPTTSVNPSTPVCANRLQDSDSGPKCNCFDKSPFVPSTTVCANRLQDSESGPKCDCANKSHTEPTIAGNPTTPVCANRLQDSDSGPKCNCADKSPSEPPITVCANRLQDSDSGPKCDCANRSPPESTTPVDSTAQVCANRLQDSDSGPKCHCGDKSSPEAVTPSDYAITICANRLKDSNNLSKCNSANKTPPEPTTVVIPTTPVCANRLQDSDSGPKCHCADKSPPEATTPGNLVTPICANKLHGTDRGPKCECMYKSHPKPTNLVCANRLQEFESEVKLECEKKALLREVVKEPSKIFQDKEICCALRKESVIMQHFSDLKEKRLQEHKDLGYVYLVPSKKTVCSNSIPLQKFGSDTVLKIDVVCSTTDLVYYKKIIDSCCPVRIVPKGYKSQCCSTNDSSKLSIFRSGNMLDALRQLFQSSNSRTQNRKFDKNICKTCYSPLSNSIESDAASNCPLCSVCKEKLIDENEQDYRLTNYCTEPGTPASRRSPSPFGQISFVSKNNSKLSNGVEQCYPSMVTTVISTVSDDSLVFLNCEHDSQCTTCTDAATSTILSNVIRKGKIEHACLPKMKDSASDPKK